MRKTSRAASQRFDLLLPQKKRRLVKGSQLPKSPGRGVPSSGRTKRTPDMVMGDKGSLFTAIRTKLPQALIPHESGIAYTLN